MIGDHRELVHGHVEYRSGIDGHYAPPSLPAIRNSKEPKAVTSARRAEDPITVVVRPHRYLKQLGGGLANNFGE